MIAFCKLVVAARGEITVWVFCSGYELGIQTIAVYSHEERFALYRLQIDEA